MNEQSQREALGEAWMCNWGVLKTLRLSDCRRGEETGRQSVGAAVRAEVGKAYRENGLCKYKWDFFFLVHSGPLIASW